MKGQNLKATTPAEYLAALDGPRRGEIAAIDAFIRAAVPAQAPFVLSGMLAYGPIRYAYASGRTGDWARVMLASNKNYVSLYVCATNARGGYLAEQYASELGKVTCGKSCIRFKRFDDLDPAVLTRVLRETETCGFDVARPGAGKTGGGKKK